MGGVTKERRRLLSLARMLLEETDDDHGLTMSEIVSRLEAAGIPCERKSIYRDLAALRDMGMDIQPYERAPRQYGLATRPFDLEELSLMVDAVQSARFLTDRRSSQLVKKIRGLASTGQREELDRNVHVEGRLRDQAGSVLASVDSIQAAMRRHRKVAFTYYDYTTELKRVARRDGDGKLKRYLETPLRVVYSEGNYYLLAYNDKHEGIVVYRIDRMARLRVADESATANELTRNFDGAGFANRSFSMYGGQTVTATLLADSQVINAFVDRFGDEMTAAPANGGTKARITVSVMDSPTFYGWVAQFGPQVRIEAPASLAAGFRTWLTDTLAAY